MHDVACDHKFARAVVRSKDEQEQLARTSLTLNLAFIFVQIFILIVLFLPPKEV